jgi:putative ABC transport system permease protein
MFKNHLKIAVRNLSKNKIFSIINIIGLAIGLSASYVIGLIIFYDLTFDKFHKDHENIYRVTTTFDTPEGTFNNYGVPVPLGNNLKNNIPGIEIVSPFFTTYINKIENKETNSTFKNIEDAIYADENYFQLFNYKWIAGSTKKILTHPNEIVLTNNRASKYFPNLTPTEIIGKTLLYDNESIVTVTGIVEKQKERTDLDFQEFLSLKTAATNYMKDQIYNDNWLNTNSATQVFLKVLNSNHLKNIKAHLSKLAEEHTEERMTKLGYSKSFILQPLKAIHFSKHGIFNNSGNSASKTLLSSLGAIAVFLLLLGCVNFINLNTAQATKRSLEIGIRKTLGSSKKQLIFQFLGETFLLTICSAIVSLFFSYWLIKIFSDFIPEGISIDMFSNPLIFISIIILLLLVTLLSGLYPSIILSNFKPIDVLKKQLPTGENNISLRKYLTVFQFVIAQVFIIATILVGKQMHYLMNKDMGIKTNAVAYIRLWHDDDYNNRLNFFNEVKSISGISKMSLGGDPPVSTNSQSAFATYISNGKEINSSLQLLKGDLNYCNLYGINIIAGRERLNDTINEYLINETYSKLLGFQNPTEVIGQTIKINGAIVPIVGVMEDFNQRSLRGKIIPMALISDISRNKYSKFNTMHFSLKGTSENWSKTIRSIEKKWDDLYPDADFEIHFMDEMIKQFYEQEQKTSTLLKWATGLAIIISCLGLLGLVIFTTERRIKEIGIRKVLGASLTELNILLCKDFISLVAIGFIIATPIAWYGLNHWLEGFSYRTSISWWVFLLSGLVMLIITLLVVSFKTLSTAKSNPVDSLQTE